jgi:hypothetical protein
VARIDLCLDVSLNFDSAFFPWLTIMRRSFSENPISVIAGRSSSCMKVLVEFCFVRSPETSSSLNIYVTRGNIHVYNKSVDLIYFLPRQNLASGLTSI